MKTKSTLIPGFTAYDITPVTDYTVAVPPAVAPTIAPVTIHQRLTRTTAPRILTPSLPSASEESDDDAVDDGLPIPPPIPHAPFYMNDTNAPLTPRLPRELCNLETFYNPTKPGDQGNIALRTHINDINEDEMLA
jgi:hypothetical protein